MKDKHKRPRYMKLSNTHQIEMQSGNSKTPFGFVNCIIFDLVLSSFGSITAIGKTWSQKLDKGMRNAFDGQAYSIIWIKISQSCRTLYNYNCQSINTMSFVSSPEHFLDIYRSLRCVDVFAETHLLGALACRVWDFQLCREDRQFLYSDDEDFLLNVRDGCSIVEIKGKMQWGRRALPYMFQYSVGQLDDIGDKKAKRLRGSIFSKVKQSFQRGCKIEIIKTELTDGANIQVSYLGQVKGWCIGCNQYSVIVRNHSDIEGYDQKPGREAVIKVASEWIKLVSNLSNSQMQQLKQVLTNHTMVGQLVESSHIVKYQDRSFVWRALVSHFSSAVCLDIFQSKKLLGRLGLKFVRIKSMAVLNNFDTLLQFVNSLGVRVFQAGIMNKEYGGMGTTLYFVQHTKSSNDTHLTVVSALKFLTLEYKMFSHIQYLFGVAAEDLESEGCLEIADYLHEFQNQWSYLLATYSLECSFPLGHYEAILRYGLCCVKTHKFTKQFLQSYSFQFVDTLFYCQHKNLSLKKQMVTDHKFIGRLREIQWADYGVIGCKNILVYIPLGIRGLGKSYLGRMLAHQFARLKYPFLCIGTKSQEQMNSSSNVKTIVDFINTPHTKQMNASFIYIDVDYTPQQLKRFIETFSHNTSPECFYKFIYIVPRQDRNMTYQDYQYPFSYQDVLTSLKQTIKTNKSVEVASNTIELMQSYQNVTIKQYLQRGIQYQYPFVGCKILTQQEYLKEEVNRVLLTKKGDKQQVRRLMEIIDLNVEIVYPNGQVVSNEIDQLISKAFAKIPTLHK